MAVVVEVKGLIKRFGTKVVLKQLNLNLEKGEFAALLGPNGAGKTTFMRILATLSKASAGQIRINGFEIPGQSAEVRRQLGVVEHLPLLYGDLSAEENLEFFARLYALENIDKRIDNVLSVVGLSNRRKDLVRTFSRGMQQRLAIGRAILHEPEVLLLDEPHTGLDQAASDMLDETLRRVTSQRRTILMTSHDLARVDDLASRFLVLNHATVVADRSKQELGSENVLDFYKSALMLPAPKKQKAEAAE